MTDEIPVLPGLIFAFVLWVLYLVGRKVVRDDQTPHPDDYSQDLNLSHLDRKDGLQ